MNQPPQRTATCADRPTTIEPLAQEKPLLLPPTLDKLPTLRLTGMAKACQEQQTLPDSHSLSCEERLGL